MCPWIILYVFFLFQGVKHFDFIPESYIIPEEFNEFNGKCFCHAACLHWVGFVVLTDDLGLYILYYLAAFLKDRKPWIVKPVASSRGRGIYLVNHVSTGIGYLKGSWLFFVAFNNHRSAAQIGE